MMSDQRNLLCIVPNWIMKNTCVANIWEQVPLDLSVNMNIYHGSMCCKFKYSADRMTDWVKCNTGSVIDRVQSYRAGLDDVMCSFQSELQKKHHNINYMYIAYSDWAIVAHDLRGYHYHSLTRSGSVLTHKIVITQRLPRQQQWAAQDDDTGPPMSS